MTALHPPVQVEANIFSRIVRVIRSYITGAVESFEDPEVMLDRITAEMQEDAARMRQVRGAAAAANGCHTYIALNSYLHMLPVFNCTATGDRIASS